MKSLKKRVEKVMKDGEKVIDKLVSVRPVGVRGTLRVRLRYTGKSKYIPDESPSA